MARYQPLFIDFTGKRVVVFGGGPVGERKAAYFAGANVTVVSRDFTPGLESMPGIRRVRQHVVAADVPGLVKDAFLVVAATGNPALDREIARMAGEAGALANSAAGGSEVILPAKIVRDDIIVAVSTGGTSPAMARFIRQRLESSLGRELADMARLQSSLRETLKKEVPSQEERERLLWKVLEDPDVWDALKISYNNGMLLAIEKLRKEI
ncbi:MAG: siroheme synthase [Methanocella sp. PtaU1.Bin125]|nr:MAG: siroheme synthase [Methanocella sp. PtaU1.Bin125]